MRAIAIIVKMCGRIVDRLSGQRQGYAPSACESNWREGEFAHQYDALANTHALLDEAGAVEARYKYTAFGEVSAVSVENGPWGADNWPDLPPPLSSNMR